MAVALLRDEFFRHLEYGEKQLVLLTVVTPIFTLGAYLGN